MHSKQFKPKSYLKLIKKYIFSEGEQIPLNGSHFLEDKKQKVVGKWVIKSRSCWYKNGITAVFAPTCQFLEPVQKCFSY